MEEMVERAFAYGGLLGTASMTVLFGCTFLLLSERFGPFWAALIVASMLPVLALTAAIAWDNFLTYREWTREG